MDEVKGESTDIDLTNLETLNELPIVFQDKLEPVDRTKVKEAVDNGVVTPRTIRKYTGRLYPCKSCGKEKIKEPRSGKIPEYCLDCRHDIHLIALKKARLAKTRETAFTGTLEYEMPDGFVATIQSAEEKTFLERRVGQYLKDFEWKESADLSVLSRLILMELQCNRIMKLLTLKYRGADSKVLGELSEEIRKCQELLGIDRVSRESDKSGDNPYDIVKKMIDKFSTYKKDHPERFMWRCKHCDAINSIAIENPDVPKVDTVNEKSIEVTTGEVKKVITVTATESSGEVTPVAAEIDYASIGINKAQDEPDETASKEVVL